MEYFNTVFNSRVEKLFSKELINQVATIDTIQSASDGVSSSELGDLLLIERRSVLNNVDKINSIIDTISSSIPIPKIIKVEKKFFFEGSSLDAQRIIMQLIGQSTLANLCIRIVNQKSVSTEQFMAERFISSAAFYRMLQKLNDYLTPLGIHIINKRGILTVIGNEREIRYILTGFLWRIYRGVTWPFVSITQNEVKAVTNKLIESLGININNAKRDELMYILAVNILRHRNGSTISNKELPNYSNKLINSLLNKQYTQFKKLMTPLMDEQNNDLIFIFIWLASLPELYLSNNLVFSFYEALTHVEPDIVKGIDSFIDAVQKIKNDLNLYKEKLFLSTIISSRIAADLFPQLTFIISSVNIYEYKDRFAPSLIPVIQRFLETDSTLDNIQKHTLAFKYSNAFALVLPINIFEPKINIYIETDFPIYIDVQIKKELYALLSTTYNIAIRESPKLPECDLAINFNLSANSSDSEGIPRIYTHVHMSDGEKNQILEQCRKILIRKKSQQII
ncbi:hypothetical protein ESZ50_09120 [Weissella muntiaci]|uniref:Mga helix-turn-helix domain-containing protein n=1 Tax=Weissella muntiaci TaxID=2508881 RepID=A0A6C2C323_9LACO|nr:helix-turn-helix domain-containing protein [Weissella muntiaci]TYC48361.1 hypothetical protein ESZ50_09120 [Weissella muntiaci]